MACVSPCEAVEYRDGHAVVCSGRTRRTRHICDAEGCLNAGDRQCDGYRRDGSSCDRFVCSEKHAKRTGRNTDLCEYCSIQQEPEMGELTQADRDTHERRRVQANAYHKLHPELLQAFYEETGRAIAAGETRTGARSIWERMKANNTFPFTVADNFVQFYALAFARHGERFRSFYTFSGCGFEDMRAWDESGGNRIKPEAGSSEPERVQTQLDLSTYEGGQA